jgi:hypothetical protein
LDLVPQVVVLWVQPTVTKKVVSVFIAFSCAAALEKLLQTRLLPYKTKLLDDVVFFLLS